MSNGQVLKIHSDFYYVLSNGEQFELKLREVLKKQQKRICVGDFVEFENGYITKLLDRKNFIPRPCVSNVDQIVIVSAIEEPHLDFQQLDRYIAFSEYCNLDIKLCFNKNDLTRSDDVIDKIFSIYEPLGYDIIFTSALEKLGIEDFREIMEGKTSVLCGTSGAGKSSLLNALNPDFQLRTKTISEKTGRGTHTTRHCEILNITENTRIIDTPGFSNLKFDFLMPWDVGKLFREMRPHLGQCKFQNCVHIQETGCGVKDNITTTRYESYKCFVEEAKEYKERVKFEGKKKESFEKQNNDKTAVKISAQKRQGSRRTLKQRLNNGFTTDEDETNE